MKKRCDQCESTVINGVYCHEHGCPNRGKTYYPNFKKWLTDEELHDRIDMMDFRSEWD